MINTSILVFDEVVSSSVTGVIDLINGTNKYLVNLGKPAAFRLQLVSESLQTNFPAAPAAHIKHKTLKKAGRPDLVIVPSFNVGNESILDENKPAIRWIKKLYGTGTEIASLCVGSYFLAEAGLLDGKEVTSHWAAADDIQKKYPLLIMKSDLVITDKDGIYTSGGAFSSLKLVLYLIEKFCGRETALWVSKMFAIEMESVSQAHFAVFTGQHQHDDEEILQAQLYIEKNYQEELSIGNVSNLVHMGNRNFIRRFKAATSNTPIEYLQRVRIESAKKAIEMSEKDLSLIIDNTGYKDLKTFRTIFKRFTGLSPMEYKKKYARTRQ